MNEEVVRRLAIAKAYIDERIEADMAWQDGAIAAGFSPFHFHRLFRSWIGCTVTAYVRDRRLLRAAEEVRDTEARLIDIGLANGFEAPESFSRAFKRKYGLTPGEYRKSRRGGVYDMHVRIVERQPTRVVGVSVRTDITADRNISEAWKHFSSKCGHIPNVKAAAQSFGFEIYEEASKGLRAGEFTYVACVEVEGAGETPGMLELIIPGGRYAVVTHQGSTERLQETFRYVYGTWLPDSGEQLRGWNGSAEGFDFEAYDERFREGDPLSELDLFIPLQG